MSIDDEFEKALASLRPWAQKLEDKATCRRLWRAERAKVAALEKELESLRRDPPEDDYELGEFDEFAFHILDRHWDVEPVVEQMRGLYAAERAKLAALVEACEAALPYLDDHVARLGIGDSRIAVSNLRAALAQARGEAPTEDR